MISAKSSLRRDKAIFSLVRTSLLLRRVSGSGRGPLASPATLNDQTIQEGGQHDVVARHVSGVASFFQPIAQLGAVDLAAALREEVNHFVVTKVEGVAKTSQYVVIGHVGSGA